MKIRSLLIALLSLFSMQSFGQNCGIIDSVSFDVVDNGNGTSDYSFVAYISTTAGGSKSVGLQIYCGTDTMVNDSCILTQTTQISKAYGAFTRPHCTSSLFVNWQGYTNTTCGGSSCAGDTGVSVVPVSFMGMEFNCETNMLSWQTASEINNQGFEVQVLQSGNWKVVGWVPGMGTSNSVVSYSYTLPYSLRKDEFVRLKQVDFDQRFDYSKILTVNCEGLDEFGVFPNPAKDFISFDHRMDRVEVFTLQGVQLQSAERSFGMDIQNIHPGMYYVHLYRFGKREVKTVVVKR